MTGLIYVQDQGTGLDKEVEASWADAANLMAAVHDSNTTQYVVNDPTVTTDFANDQVTIGPVQAAVEVQNVSTENHIGSGGQQVEAKTWPEVTVTVYVDQQTVGINATGTTDIYAQVDVEAADPNQVELTTTQPATGILVATVDADAETVTKQNLRPDGEFAALEANTLLGADVANAPENQILVVQGDGTLSAETQAQGPNPYDQAQSFGESDVTVTTNDTSIKNGSIGLLTSEKYEITDAIFDTSVDPSTSDPWGMAWKPDGTELVLADESAQKLYQYDLSTAYDITTITETATFDLTQNEDPTGILWNNDGTKAFVPERAGSDVKQYSASSSYDVTSLSFDNESLGANTTSVQGAAFNNDGSKIFVITDDGTNTSTVEEYSLSTSYDLSNFTLNNTISVQEDNAQGIVFNDDGSQMYVIGWDDSAVLQYVLSTPFDTSTATLDASINTGDSFPSGLSWNDDGSVFYELSNSNGSALIYQYNLINANSGDVTIEWDRSIPIDIFEWDVATYTRSLDGETVDVFVAYSSDGGSTWTRSNSGNPINRSYSLRDDPNITADVDVRIETELSRADTANNPTLDSAYRSWLV